MFFVKSLDLASSIEHVDGVVICIDGMMDDNKVTIETFQITQNLTSLNEEVNDVMVCSEIRIKTCPKSSDLSILVFPQVIAEDLIINEK